TAVGRLVHEDYDNILHLVTADETDVGTVEQVVVVTATGLGDLRCAGLTTNYVAALVERLRKGVVLNDVLHERYHLLPYLGTHDVLFHGFRFSGDSLIVSFNPLIDKIRLIISPPVEYR